MKKKKKRLKNLLVNSMPIKKKAIEKIGTHLADTFPLFLLFIIVEEKRFKLSTNPQKIHTKFSQ